MLYHLLYPLRDKFGGFNVFRYITFRSAGAVLTALLVSFILAPSMIAWLRRLRVGQHVRDDGPQTHLTKQGTPTMGGVLIIAALVSSMLLWSDLANKYVWVVLFATLTFGGIGFWDDYLKVVKKRSTGLRAVQKFGLQIAASLAIAFFLYFNRSDPNRTILSLPLVKELFLDLGWFYIPFVVIVIVGSSNAVNLTDGLDGLAIGLVGIASTANAVIVYLGGNKIIADYLKILYIPGSGELAIFCGAMLGASLGFLWYNAHPAEVFMGDVGSLSLGGALGTLAVVTKHELILVIVGGIFVAETVSVMLQVASYKLTGKRIFKMAPVHHHFEQIGWPESKVIVRFWIIGIILALISIGSLKLR
jgi:phospho-N-acetylmuramoyl-pentapeptide-transferase